MIEWKTKKFWFYILNVGICLTFSCFTFFNAFNTPSKIYTENYSEKNVEGDEKPTEEVNPYYIHELTIQFSLVLNDFSPKNLMPIKFNLPSHWPSPNTPPPDLS